MNNYSKNTVRTWSIISGVSIIVMAVAAGIAYGYVLNQLYVEGSRSATAANIENNSTLYLFGSLLWCLILLTDLAVSYGFYRFLRTIRKIPSLAAGLLRLAYSVILAAGIVFMFRGDIESFLNYWTIGLFIFGFHLVITGITVLYGTNLLRILGVLLITAGIGYSLVHGILIFMPEAADLAARLENILRIPMTTGELLFGIWLLARGGLRANRRS